MTIKLLLTAGLLAGSTLAMAAPQPAPMPPPPPIRVTVAPPPPMFAGCSAESTVDFPKSDWGMCLITKGGWIYARTVNWKTGQRDADQLLEHSALFSMLASTRMEKVWPDLIAFIGEDGSKLRAALRKRAEMTLRGTMVRPRDSVPLDNFVSGSVLAVIQAADFYSQAGDMRTVRSLIADKRGEVESLGLSTEPMQFAWISLLLRLARLENIHGAPEKSIALYQAIAANQQIPLNLRANGLVNHAALLAELRQSREALTTLALAEAASGAGSEQVAGSNRQFAWIRACALSQLGDKKGAAKAIDVIRKAPAELRNASGQLMSTESIEVRMAYCMDDDESLARLMRNDGGYLVDPAALALQEGRIMTRPTNLDTNQRMAQRFARTGYKPAVRQIPSALLPALNYWRVAPLRPSAPVQVPAAVGTKG